MVGAQEGEYHKSAGDAARRLYKAGQTEQRGTGAQAMKEYTVSGIEATKGNRIVWVDRPADGTVHLNGAGQIFNGAAGAWVYRGYLTLP